MRIVLVALFSALATIGIIDTSHSQGSVLGQVGEHEYLNSCASCHSLVGKGDGPVARTLNRAPTNLTKLSEENKGVFPFSRTYQIIDGRVDVAAHGKRDMPVWGDVYNPMWTSAVAATPPYAKELYESIARARILALIEYISTLQGK